jgi:CHAT domain-containing protein
MLRLWQIFIAFAGGSRYYSNAPMKKLCLAALLCSLSFTVFAQGDTTVRAKQLTAEGEQLFAKGTAEARRQALEKYQQALALYQAQGDQAGSGAALSDIGAIYDSLGEKQKALEFYQRALPLRREAGDRQGEATTLNNLGVAYRSLGEMRRALDCYRQSLALAQALGDRENQATTLNNLGAVWRALGELQQALDAYAQALPLWQALKNTRGEAVTLSNLGGVYRSLGEQEKALEFYQHSLIRAREAKDRRVEGETLNNIGAAQRALGQPQPALEFFNQALEIRRAVGDKRGEAVTLSNMASAAVSLNDPRRALALHTDSLKLWRAVGDRSGEGGALHNLGEISLILGDKTQARQYFTDALPLRRAVEDPAGEANTLYGLARLDRDENRLSEARANIEAALAIVETLRAKVASQDLRASFFASVQKYYEFYVALLMAQGEKTRAWQASEQARARSLLDLLQEARADLRQNVDPQLLNRERELLELINAKAALQTQAYGNPARAAVAKALGEEINQLAAEYETLQTRIRQSNPRYAELTRMQPPALSDAQAALGAETVLLEYKLGDEKSYLWRIAANDFAANELPPRAAIETAAREVYQHLTERNRAVKDETPAARKARLDAAEQQFTAAAARLNAMLGPALPPGNRRVVVVADGALQFVPFSVLPLAAGHEVVALPSVAVLAQLRREQRQASKSVAVFADPVFEADDPRLRAKPASDQTLRDFPPAPNGLPRLFASRDEANAVIRLAPRNTVLRALDFDASRERATDAALGQYRILHFATHSLINTSRPEFSGVVLSLFDAKGQPRDGFLRLNQIYNLRLNSDLVVLSACQTALGKEVRGEGLVGLTRGFMHAGAKSVVASLWKVDDEATAELMKLFYQNHLTKKMPPAQALRAAQTELQKQTRWRSPYFWGAFTLQGDWR